MTMKVMSSVCSCSARVDDDLYMTNARGIDLPDTQFRPIRRRIIIVSVLREPSVSEPYSSGAHNDRNYSLDVIISRVAFSR